MAEEVLEKEGTGESEELLEEGDSEKDKFMTFQTGKEFFVLARRYRKKLPERGATGAPSGVCV